MSGRALVGTGRRARIDVEEADRQLAAKLDPARRKQPKPTPKQVEATRSLPAEVWELIRGWPEGVAVNVAAYGGTATQVYDAYECAVWDFTCHAREIYGAEIPEPFDLIDWPYLIAEHGFAVDLDALKAERDAFHGFVD